MRQWSNEEIQRYLGEERGCYLGHSTDDEVRDGAASGGTTSQVLINLLDEGLVDGVLVWRMRCDQPDPVAEPIIATTRDEILEARGSKYVVVSYPRQALPLIREFEGRLALVTLPCDASYLRRKMRIDPELASKVHCIVTLFCGHNSESELTKIIVRRHGMQWQDVESFSYRTGVWRGRLTFSDGKGRDVDVPTRTFTHYQNLHFFSDRKCLNCTDHFGYDGDICTGDIWSREAKGDDIKPTLLVARTQRGREFLDRAGDQIEMKPVPASTVVGGNSRGMTYHYQISARAKAGRLFGIKIVDPLRLPVTLLDRLVATIGLFNYWWSHHPRYKHWIEKLPMWSIRGYIYLFKGLQQLNLFLYRPFPPTYKLSIIGSTLIGNRGAEAMTVTAIGRIRKALPEARFVLHSYFPKRDRELCLDRSVEIVDATPLALCLRYTPFAVADAVLGLLGMRWPRSWMPGGPRELRDSRALLDLFGVSYSDGREKFLPFNVLSNWPAMLMKVPVVKLSQGLGSFEGRLTRTLGRWMLRKCAVVYARGRESLQMVRKLGVGEHLDIAPDVALIYDESYSLTSENAPYERELLDRLDTLRQRGTDSLVISVSSVVLGKCEARGIDYVDVMARTVEHFLGEGRAVVIFPNATREGLSTLRNNDLPVVDAIRSRVDCHGAEDRLVAVDRDLNTASLRRVLARTDWLVASRFHAMIAGLALGIPTMVLGWGHKYREVLAQFELEENAYDFSELEAEGLIRRIKSFMAQSDLVRDRIHRNLEKVKAESDRQFERLIEDLMPIANVCTDDDEAGVAA